MKSQFLKVYTVPSSKDGKFFMKQATKFLLEKFNVSLNSALKVEPEKLQQGFRYYVTVGDQAPFPRDVALVWREEKRTANKSTFNMYFRDVRYRETKVTSLEALYHMLTIIPVPRIELMPQEK